MTEAGLAGLVCGGRPGGRWPSDVTYGRKVGFRHVLASFQRRWLRSGDIVEAVRGELLPWITGAGDPVRARAGVPAAPAVVCWVCSPVGLSALAAAG